MGEDWDTETRIHRAQYFISPTLYSVAPENHMSERMNETN